MPPEKPLEEWARRHDDWLVEVYSDETATIYAVRDGWQKLLKEYNVPPVDKVPMAW